MAYRIKKERLEPSPYQVLWASQRKPKKVYKFKNEDTALAFREGLLREGKVALLGSREIEGKRIYEVEIY